MKVRLLKRVVLDNGSFGRPGDIVTYNPTRGAVILRRKIGVEVFTKPESTKPETQDQLTNDPAAEDPTPTRPTGSRTGRGITSSSLRPVRPPRKRGSRKRKAAAKSSP